MAEAMRTTVQRMFISRLAIELIFDAIQSEAAICDPVGESARNGAEMRRVGEVILEGVQTKQDAIAGRSASVPRDRAAPRPKSGSSPSHRLARIARPREPERRPGLPKMLVLNVAPPLEGRGSG